jgi:ElaB/YqjD/DUF883 family membrane-anchored ribosome-binding protein
MGKDESEIRKEIEETRTGLGDTVEALAYKTDVKARVKDAVDDRVTAAKGSLTSAVETVKDTVADAMGTTRQTVKNTTRKVARSSSQAASRVGDRADDARDAIGSGIGRVAQNPLGLVGGAFAVGYLIGLALPVTNMERARIGPLRDALVDHAQEAVHDVVERGQQAVADIVESATTGKPGPA